MLTPQSKLVREAVASFKLEWPKNGDLSGRKRPSMNGRLVDSAKIAEVEDALMEVRHKAPSPKYQADELWQLNCLIYVGKELNF